MLRFLRGLFVVGAAVFAFISVLIFGAQVWAQAAPVVAPSTSATVSVVTTLLNMFGGSIIPPLLAAIALWICSHIVALIQLAKTWVAAHTSATTSASVAAGLDMAQGVMCTLVNNAENTTVDLMRKSGDWGKPEAYKQVADAVLADAMTHVQAAAPQLVATFGDGLKNILSAMLEQEVAKLSAPKPAHA